MKGFDNDTDLLAALKIGESRAFDTIYQLHFRALCYYAQKICGNTQAAEDKVAESFVKLLQNKPDFESLAKLKSWLYTITHNACINYIQQQKRRDVSHLEISRSQVNEEILETELVRAEVLQAIYTAIETLPKKCRRIIQLSFIDGKKIEEIAAEMNIAYHTVQNQKTRGIKLLRLALLDHEGLTPAVLLACYIFLSEEGAQFWDKTAAQLL